MVVLFNLISFGMCSAFTCSDVGAVFCVELFFNERFRLFGELFWYFDISKLAMISDNFSSKSWHQNLFDSIRFN